jgi:ATP-binding cassette subfamily A (ABC1) protein 2
VADVFIYAILAWYFTQIWPTSEGVPKPWYFPFLRNYWFPESEGAPSRDYGREVSDSNNGEVGSIPIEAANETLLGAPTIKVNHLFKTFGKNRVVDDLSLRMYENQIFALLGHNGAGKTTTINILTGMISPDSGSVGDVTIYGEHLGNQSGRARKSLGVCPQHDVLFEKLSIKEHIMFFAQLKGKSYEEAKSESEHLIDLFHLEHRRAHLGSELSGGQKRKLSVAIAVCGGSKFVVLDEPTAGG